MDCTFTPPIIQTGTINPITLAKICARPLGLTYMDLGLVTPALMGMSFLPGIPGGPGSPGVAGAPGAPGGPGGDGGGGDPSIDKDVGITAPPYVLGSCNYASRVDTLTSPTYLGDPPYVAYTSTGGLGFDNVDYGTAGPGTPNVTDPQHPRDYYGGRRDARNLALISNSPLLDQWHRDRQPRDPTSDIQCFGVIGPRMRRYRYWVTSSTFIDYIFVRIDRHDNLGELVSVSIEFEFAQIKGTYP